MATIAPIRNLRRSIIFSQTRRWSSPGAGHSTGISSDHHDIPSRRLEGQGETRRLDRCIAAGTEPLLERIIHIATHPGEVVLDRFLGSGTTAAVAHKMGRRSVGIEWEPSTVATYALPRLTKVVTGDDRNGISAAVGWQGGGGFRLLDVAPSMFEADGGRAYLADWAVNGSLAEATAAQLGYEHEVQPPFCGRKGRTRLTVVDGLVNDAVARVPVGALDKDERGVVCGTGIDPICIDPGASPWRSGELGVNPRFFTRLSPGFAEVQVARAYRLASRPRRMKPVLGPVTLASPPCTYQCLFVCQALSGRGSLAQS